MPSSHFTQVGLVYYLLHYFFFEDLLGSSLFLVMAMTQDLGEKFTLFK